jgi:antitoxin HigA-1
MLSDSSADADLRVPPSSHLRKLNGTLVGWHSIRVNEQWRLVFRWNASGGEASEVYLSVRRTMIMTKRKPATIGEILVEEFLVPLNLTQGDLAQAMGVPRKHVNELCNNRRAITADTALMLARVFSNSADFWLNVQRRSDLWQALHSPKRRQRIERARALRSAAA